MAFTIDSATDYIRSKLTNFYDARTDLENQRQRVDVVIKYVSASGEDPSEAYQIRGEIQENLNRHANIATMLKPFADYFGVSTGLGVIPPLLAGVAIVAATSLVLFYRHYDLTKRKLELIEQQKLPPSALGGGIGGLFGQINTLVLLGLIGLGIFVFARPARAQAGGR